MILKPFYHISHTHATLSIMAIFAIFWAIGNIVTYVAISHIDNIGENQGAFVTLAKCIKSSILQM